MGWGDFVKIRDLGSARESQALRKAALRLATDLDAYIIGYAAKASNNWLGDGNSVVGTWDSLASAYTRLKQEGVDSPEQTAVLDYADRQALGSDVVADNASLANIGDGVYRSGFMGNVAGFRTLFTQQLPAMTVGTRVASATSVTNYSSGNFDNVYSAVCNSASTNGYFKTGLLNFDGQSGSVTLKDGEVFTIAGIYAYDNQAKKQLNHLQQFRVVGDYTASSGAFTNVRYYPAVITTGPEKTVVNTNGGGSTWDGLSITHIGAAGATLHPRFVADKEAITVSTADLIMPATGTARRMNLSKVPMSVRMWQHSDFGTGAHSIRFDVAVECNTLANGRERLVRVNGS